MTRVWALLLTSILTTGSGFAATRHHRKRPHTPQTSQSSRMVAVRHSPSSHLSRLAKSRKKYVLETWTEPNFADSTAGDLVDGEDLAVRRAAVQALGPFNGSIVVADPQTGRLLTVVNQKLAYKGGFEPCSTIKLVAALAGLKEGVIDSTTLLRVGRRRTMDLTDALAHSNNWFFARIGEQLGFERVVQYAKLYGLGEKAGWNISEEDPAPLPSDVPQSGLGMMTSFGEGFNLSPLQLTSLMSAIANGGTMYYLQHPKSSQEEAQFVPRVKRQLEIDKWINDLKPGLLGAVEYGTARRASYEQNMPILGKTGTCTDVRSPIHLGWFASYNDVGSRKLVVTVLLTGGARVKGAVAAGVAGAVYRNLQAEGYFGDTQITPPMAFMTLQSN